MSVSSGLQQGYQPTVYRTVAASADLKAVSGAPKRCAAMLLFTNANAAAAPQTAVFTGPDATNVTMTVPAMSQSSPLYGNFATTGAFGADITCIAGWIDDGTVQLNP